MSGTSTLLWSKSMKHKAGIMGLALQLYLLNYRALDQLLARWIYGWLHERHYCMMLQLTSCRGKINKRLMESSEHNLSVTGINRESIMGGKLST